MSDRATATTKPPECRVKTETFIMLTTSCHLTEPKPRIYLFFRKRMGASQKTIQMSELNRGGLTLTREEKKVFIREQT
jgi:hypothetical protein